MPEQTRRRKGQVGQTRRKLSVDESQLDREKYEYRFINDDPGRVSALTEHDDWEIVKDRSKTLKADGDGLGAGVSKVVGKDENGKPVSAHLVRKLKSYADADAKAKQDLIDRQMTQIKRGPSPEQGGIGAKPGASYVPEGGIQIQEGSRQ
jgi:hypothetical protein